MCPLIVKFDAQQAANQAPAPRRVASNRARIHLSPAVFGTLRSSVPHNIRMCVAHALT